MIFPSRNHLTSGSGIPATSHVRHNEERALSLIGEWLKNRTEGCFVISSSLSSSSASPTSVSDPPAVKYSSSDVIP